MVNAVKEAEAVSAKARNRVLRSATQDVKARIAFSLFLLLSLSVIVFGDYYGPRTRTQKVKEAELIVRGVATLDGLPLASTDRPIKRSCSIVVLETLWPTNRPATNTLVVDRWVWTKWPDTWWNYNSKTGVYFLVRTTTAVEKARARMKRESTGFLEIDDNFLGTNTWIPLDRHDDWYEPTTNVTEIQQLIKTVKKD